MSSSLVSTSTRLIGFLRARLAALVRIASEAGWRPPSNGDGGIASDGESSLHALRRQVRELRKSLSETGKR